MLEGLYSAAAGMEAQQLQLDAVSNDLANVSTDGYKSERVAFGDLLYSSVNVAGTETAAGAGAEARIVGRSETQGALKETGNPLDLAIEGDGYFVVTRSDGSKALERGGALELDGKGEIVDANGNRLTPPIKLPAGVSASELRIADNGTVSAKGKKLGQIELMTVTAPGHLLAEGDGLLIPNKETGPLKAASGTITQGALEDSNVDIGSDMTTMMTTERAYQMSSTAVQTESQMMQIANQLRTS
jgi:flagellar basal-body rod protein FlgG